MKYLIYAWFNIKDKNKPYIGKTNNLERRTYQHWYSAKNNKEQNIFTKALQKYSNKEDWIIKVLEKDIPLEKIKEREDYWIDFYNAIQNGYNSKKSGASSKHFNSKKIEMRDKNNPKILLAEFDNVREAAYFLEKQYNDSPNIAACCRNDRKTAYGYCWNFKGEFEEWYKHFLSQNSKRGPKNKIILMCDKNNHNIVLKEFSSKNEIKRFLNRDKISSIDQNLVGSTKSGYGYFWKYK